ncbi:hypothetical protein NQ156_06375 [Microbacterium sp. zg.Y625]|uniref:hypothetical protein n=1 Tax=Microbacterium jiangjiandongii TaxID=3049071 RepID=UPI00214B3F84|nr:MULTISPECIES: hypothetical protein [unclassified Microbacterium]MCR2792690.1 hypothetical protein [Microbacterium sp. zg.Y625]MCR2814622.1 hypothetical protein [Microbacterium sp. zg.Y843]WIM26669.1 hypothetical protein QNO14_06400 [Microbacterium sp. zg-Y625]
MFVLYALYAVLFLLGFYLFGLSFAIDTTPVSGFVFAAGVIAVSLALALMVHAPGTARREDS